MFPIHIETEGEYDYAVERGYSPLFDRRFEVNGTTRKAVIGRKFPKYTVQNNSKFYRWYWDNYQGERCCEECGMPLRSYSAVFVSHILTRNGHRHIAYDPMNINLLCFEHHRQWEQQHLARKLRIYKSNQVRIDKLLGWYGK